MQNTQCRKRWAEIDHNPAIGPKESLLWRWSLYLTTYNQLRPYTCKFKSLLTLTRTEVSKFERMNDLLEIFTPCAPFNKFFSLIKKFHNFRNYLRMFCKVGDEFDSILKKM
jgi:hypothetical protein